MTLLTRLLLAALLVATGQAAALGVRRYYTPAPAVMPKTPLSSIPNQLGLWTAEPVEIEPRLIEGSGAASMINRRYTSPLGLPILASIGIWTDYDVQVPHKPELCYPSAGWEYLDKRDVNFKLSGGRASRGRLLLFRREDTMIAVLFWCRLGDFVALDNEDVRGFQQRLRGRDTVLPPAIKVTLQTPVADRDQAESLLLDFAPLLLEHTSRIR